MEDNIIDKLLPLWISRVSQLLNCENVTRTSNSQTNPFKMMEHRFWTPVFSITKLCNKREGCCLRHYFKLWKIEADGVFVQEFVGHSPRHVQAALHGIYRGGPSSCYCVLLVDTTNPGRRIHCTRLGAAIVFIYLFIIIIIRTVLHGDRMEKRAFTTFVNKLARKT